MTDLQFNQLTKELSNLSLRLIHMESTHIEKADELIDVVAGLVNEVRDLKAEAVAIGDVLIALDPQEGKK